MLVSTWTTAAVGEPSGPDGLFSDDLSGELGGETVVAEPSDEAEAAAAGHGGEPVPVVAAAGVAALSCSCVGDGTGGAIGMSQRTMVSNRLPLPNSE